VSAQAAPSAMQWKFTTHNNKDVELHDIYVRGYQ
jgi:hypothetical protein